MVGGDFGGLGHTVFLRSQWAVREGVPVFYHHLIPQLGTQSLREQKGRTLGDPLFLPRSSFS